MNQFKNTGLVAFCLLALTFTSCKKDIEVAKEVDIETQLVGRWKLISVIIDGKESITTHLSSCDSDNAIVLETGGKGFSDFGTVKCTATEPQTKAFSWSWDDKAAKKFTINDGDKTKLTIIELNSTTMKADFVDAKSGQFTFTRL
jgi:Lipocalin-like domain